MPQPNRNFVSRYPQPLELCTTFAGCEPWGLLEKLAEHPNGIELLKTFQEFYRDVQAATQPNVELVKGRAASRVVLIDALSLAKDIAIINSPWLSKRSVDDELLLRMTALLERGCYLHIGWGYSYDIRGLNPYGNIINVSQSGKCFIDASADKVGNYSAFAELQKLRARYPDQMELKLLGTHEKYVICDRQFALMGSHNVLSSMDTLYTPREIGWKTTDESVIEAQTEYFINAPDLKHEPSLWLESKFDRSSPDPKLIAEAQEVVKQRGIVNPPKFEQMNTDELKAFINQYSLAKMAY